MSIFCVNAAQAGEERKCAKQYSLEEHLILEWAALGGDPHAQFAITQCAFPKGVKKLNDAEKIYALKWLTLANCETLNTDESLKRNIRTRHLKEQGDISFRRFGGEAKTEKLSTRDKMFRDYRMRRIGELKQRNKAIDAIVTEEDRRNAQDALVNQLSSMGELGLIRLGQLTDCAYFKTTKTFAAASWAAAQEKWSNSSLAAVSGKSEKRGWSIEKESKARHAALNTLQRQTATYEKDNLLQTTPEQIVYLEERAALADLQNLSTAFVHASEGEAPIRTVTLAVQYALEALGMVEFINGPDNDYGPTTIEAAQKLQASWGQEETRWLNHEQIRTTICKAAIEAADPISMFHVALMHANGWGFKRDYNKARAAILRAEQSIKVRLDVFEELPSWKQVHFPQYVAEIEAEKILINAAWDALPTREKTEIDSADICRSQTGIR